MYRIASTNAFFNGRVMNLPEAKKFADKWGDTYIVDVIRYVDRDTYRHVYTGGKSFTKGNVGNYRRNV